jgi:hypothetical protein
MIVYEVQTDGMVSHSTPPYSGWTIPTCRQSAPPPSHQTWTMPPNQHKQNRRNHYLQLRMKEDKGKLG